MRVPLVLHELAHAAMVPGGGVLEKERDGWRFHPACPPANGEAIVLQAVAGCCGERVFADHAGAERMLREDPRGFFDTEHASPEDLLVAHNAPEYVASLVDKYMLLDRLMRVFVEIGMHRVKRLQGTMESMPVGGKIRIDNIAMKRPWETPATVH